jgi:pimeloyl-ACP methyl ester carboxylesterase
MKLRTLGFLMIFPFLLSAWIYEYEPELALKPLYRFYLWQADLREKQVTVGDSVYSYYEGGRGPDVVLLHGFGDSKESFVQMVRYWDDHFHVILPDIAGFGESAQKAELNYSIRSQVERLKTLLDALQIKKAVLVGNSMGGHLAAAFALQHPESVQKLVLMSPAGLLVDDPIPYREQPHPLRNEADFDSYMHQVFYEIPWVPDPFKKEFIERSKDRFNWYNRIRKDIREGEDYLLNDRLSQVEAPTLILWGNQDEIIHVIHAREWNKKIPRSTLKTLDHAGHSLQYEMPESTAKWILDFIKD